MVLQRNTEVALWGWANENEKIIIEFSWLSETTELIADQEGKWTVRVKTSLSKEKQTIRFIHESGQLFLENILFGEVWLCSGQSNMEQPVRGFYGQPTFGSQEAIKNAYNPQIRLLHINKAGSEIPLEDLELYRPWAEASPESVSGFSAVGYFFAHQLQKTLDVPVGIIQTSWGGSKIEAWMSKEILNKYEGLVNFSVNEETETQHTPKILFNAMIHPLIPYSLKGFLWYQGESNRFRPEAYKKLFPAMVNDWRSRWSLSEAPFYYVQIAPFSYWDSKDAFQTNHNSAFMREAQLQCLELIPNSGIVITIDIGDSSSVHPPQKKKVANRLLGLALAKAYDFGGLNPESPIYDSLEVVEDKIVLSFKNAWNGLYAFGALEEFEIAGTDKIFYPAKALIHKKNQVKVWSDKIEKPVAVRYAWSNWVKGSLFGANLLPVSSFRTDVWNDDTVQRK